MNKSQNGLFRKRHLLEENDFPYSISPSAVVKDNEKINLFSSSKNSCNCELVDWQDNVAYYNNFNN